jgi:predicted PurR-regulated permease PerM
MALLTDRQRRWFNALLVLGTVAVAFVVFGYVEQVFFYFGDILLVFFLAWLLAFILSPVVNVIDRAVPRLPRVVAVVIVYALLIAALVVAAIVVANALAASINDLLGSIRSGSLNERLPDIVAPWQQRLNDVGLGQIDLLGQAQIFVANLSTYGALAVGPLQQLASASLGVIGNLLIVFVLSLYMVVDSERIVSFLFRLVPPGRQAEAVLLERSVSSSFGGFLRGQAVMGIVYFGVALVANAAGGLDYAPVTSVAAGLLQAIPFFGPFVSWIPPVLVAVLFEPGAIPIVLVVMAVGWVFVMNVLQPRVMEESVGIHPIVVLGSVLIGSRIAGVTGAIFGIPIAAVISAFFFHYLGRTYEAGPVALRAARRLAEREGRPIRVPREPTPESDADVEPTEPTTTPATTTAATTTAAATPLDARQQAHRRPPVERAGDA